MSAAVANSIGKRYLTPYELELLYGIGRRQQDLMRMRGTGPRFIKTSGQAGKSGGRVVYEVASVEEWLAQLPSGGGGKQVA